MVICVFDNAKDNEVAFEKAFLDAKAESEKEEMRKAEEQKEHVVCEKLERLVLDVDESSNEDDDMRLNHEEEEETAVAIRSYRER